MKSNKSLSVREIQTRNIEPIANYWISAEPKFLVSLGVDLTKRITRSELQKALTEQMIKPIREKISYTLIWEMDGKHVGHSNINKIIFDEMAMLNLMGNQNKFPDGFWIFN